IKLRRLDEWNAQRRRAAAWYGAALSGLYDLTLPADGPYAEHVYQLYVSRPPARDRLHEYLTKRGIGAGLHYPQPLHLQEAYSSLGLKQGALPMTERVAAQCLSLPMFPEMSQAQVARVAEAVRGFFGD